MKISIRTRLVDAGDEKELKEIMDMLDALKKHYPDAEIEVVIDGVS